MSGKKIGWIGMGRNASDLSAEAALPIEMGTTVDDIALTVRANLNLS